MKAKRDFVERFEGMKLYLKGDEYTLNNKERVNYLTDEGYLEDDKTVQKPVKKETKKKSGE